MPQNKIAQLLKSYNPDLPMGAGMKAQFLELREQWLAQEDAVPASGDLSDIAVSCGANIIPSSNLQEMGAVVFSHASWLQFEFNVNFLRKCTSRASPDANVERNRQMLLERSIVGLQKYGVTTERDDLNLDQWLQHLLEELLDAANYIQAAKSSLAEGDK